MVAAATVALAAAAVTVAPRAAAADTADRAVTVTGPTAGARVRGAVAVSFTAVAVTRVDLVVDGVVRDTDSTAPLALTYASAVDADGPHTLRVVGYDAADPAAVVTSAAVTVVVDNTAPRITGTNPAHADRVGRVADFTVTATDNDGVAGAELYEYAQVLGADDTAPFAVTVTSETNPRTLWWRVYDRAGNEATAVVGVNVDLLGPYGLFARPAPGTRVGSTVTATLTGVDGGGMAHADLFVEGRFAGRDRTHPYAVTASTGGRSGTIALQWQVYDGFGNMSTHSWSVVGDQAGPSLRITSGPGDNARVSGYQTVAVAASDAAGVAKVQLLVNGKVAATDTAAAYQLRVNINRYAPRAGDSVRVQVRGYDRLGNVTTSAARTWIRR